MSKHKLDIEEVRAYLADKSPETKVYLGCDSERFKMRGKWFADYVLAVVIHIDGNKGCKIFGEVRRLEDYDTRAEKPYGRMMQETFYVSELYLSLKDVLHDFEVEIHCDINPSEDAGSNCAYNAAMGYIKGVCNVTPIAKPNGFAASYAADRLKSLGHVEYKEAA